MIATRGWRGVYRQADVDAGLGATSLTFDDREVQEAAGANCGAGGDDAQESARDTEDTGSKGRNESRRSTLDVPSPKYVGSFARLQEFLDECRDGLTAPLPQARYESLCRALVDMTSTTRRSTRIKTSQSFFHGFDRKSFETVLPVFGISFEDEPMCSQCGNVFMPDAIFCRKCGAARVDGDTEAPVSRAASSSTCVGSPAAVLRCCQRVSDESIALRFSSRRSISSASVSNLAESETLEMFRSLAFDKRGRGDIEEDVAALQVAFKKPFSLLDRYRIDEQVLCSWMDCIARQYKQNPYHDWRHGFDVFHFAYMCVTAGGAARYLNFQDVLALFLATIGHDVGHFGTNNAFLVKTSHPLAMTYNDISPMENMHAHVIFQTFRMPGMNVIANFDKDSSASLRSKIIEAVLATDMSHHFELVEKFSARLSRMSENPLAPGSTEADKQGGRASRADRRMLLQGYIHMSDLGHCCRPWDVHKYAVCALEEEFFKQGDQERELGLAIMPLMDRTCDSAARSQGFFLEKLVQPLLEPFCQCVSEELSGDLMRNLKENRDQWAELVLKHGNMTAGQMIPQEQSARDEEDADENHWLGAPPRKKDAWL